MPAQHDALITRPGAPPAAGREAQAEPGPERNSWVNAIAVDGASYLRDHRVDGRVVFPAAGYSAAGIDICRALRRRCDPQPTLLLENLTFRRALRLPREAPVLLRLRYQPNDKTFDIHSRQAAEGAAPTLHASGRILHTASPPPAGLDIAGRAEECREVIDVDAFYTSLRRRGLDYGPYFQGVRALRRGFGSALAKLQCHPQLLAAKRPWQRATTLLDAAFQCVAATLPDEQSGLYVPTGVKALSIFYEELPDTLWCYARLTQLKRRILSADISLSDASGSSVAFIKKLRCLKLQSDT